MVRVRAQKPGDAFLDLLGLLFGQLVPARAVFAGRLVLGEGADRGPSRRRADEHGGDGQGRDGKGQRGRRGRDPETHGVSSRKKSGRKAGCTYDARRRAATGEYCPGLVKITCFSALGFLAAGAATPSAAAALP